MVIHYDPWWNAAVETQATDRAHRIGQKQVVTVYKLIARDTLEEKIIELQSKKKEQNVAGHSVLFFASRSGHSNAARAAQQQLDKHIERNNAQCHTERNQELQWGKRRRAEHTATEIDHSHLNTDNHRQNHRKRTVLS